MSWIGNVGKSLGGLATKAAPFLGMIPGVGTVAGGAIGGLGALMHGDGIEGMLRSGAQGAMSGMGSGFLGKIGGSIKDTLMPGGNPDLAKILATVGGVSNLVGQSKQRKSAENYNNSQIDQRNELMHNIMGPQNFNLPDISPAMATAKAPVGGPQITPPTTSSQLTAKRKGPQIATTNDGIA